jgi:hypothetical protein
MTHVNAGRLVWPLGKLMAYSLGRSKFFKYVPIFAIFAIEEE